MVPSERMPACACQHFEAGRKAAPSPPPLGELMRQGAEDGGSGGLCARGLEEREDGRVGTTEV